jgi:molybdopterin-guanine dinucleotide biosynthesis protein MobB
MIYKGTPLLVFAAWSGTGKTTLLSKLIPLLRKRDLRIALIKHAHHDFDIDQPGKDSYELRKAGADQVVVCSSRRLALIREIGKQQAEPSLQDALDVLDFENIDLVLLESFKHAQIPKIELYRHAMGKPLLQPDDLNIVAIATDQPDELDDIIEPRITRLAINDPEQIADYIVENIVENKNGNILSDDISF